MGSSVAAAIKSKIKNPFKPFGHGGGGGGKKIGDRLGRIEEKLDKLSSQAEEVGSAATAADPVSGVAGSSDTTPGTFDEGTQEAAETIYGTEQERLAASQSASALTGSQLAGGTANISGL